MLAHYLLSHPTSHSSFVVNGPMGAFAHSFFFAYILIALIGKYYNTFPRHWGAGEECFRFELESGVGVGERNVPIFRFELECGVGE